MNRKILSATAALACFAAGTTPGIAGDWNNGAGSIKDRGQVVVPVPAPQQVPDDGNARGWYLRGTIGYTLKSSGDIRSSGTDVGVYSSYDEMSGPIIGSLGYGAYINRNWRWDLTGDFRPSQPISRGSQRKYQAKTQKEAEQLGILDGNPASPTFGQTLTTRTWDVSTFDIDRTETMRSQQHTFLFNGYYEPISTGAFRPYIGAGVGFGINTLSRSYKESGVCSKTDQTFTDPFTWVTASYPRPVCTADPRTTSGGGSQTAYGISLAAALTAGVGYEIKDGLLLDVGYRMLWQGNNLTSTAQAGAPGQTNRIDMGDRTDHEIRTGVRWSIN